MCAESREAAAKSQAQYVKGMSAWNFDVKELKRQAELEPLEPVLEPLAEGDEEGEQSMHHARAPAVSPAPSVAPSWEGGDQDIDGPRASVFLGSHSPGPLPIPRPTSPLAWTPSLRVFYLHSWTFSSSFLLWSGLAAPPAMWG